jgi:predicted nucleotidyltransferase component of viral defense system
MIPEAEVRRLAGRWGVDPMVVDLDYVLGCFLAVLYRQEAAGALRFKGGTCPRKCHFPDYRFSEDLDFTAERRVPAPELQRLLEAVAAALGDDWQIDFGVRPIRVEVVDDEYGKESYQARLYYRGPLRRGGDPRAIRLDLTTAEVLVFPAVSRPILHPHSDAESTSGVEAPCYDVLETLAEKTRALAGQRQYAISRDLYDIAQLTRRQSVDPGRVAEALPRKLIAKGLAVSVVDVDRVRKRQDEFRADWERNLVHLLPPEVVMEFDNAWDRAVAFLAGVNVALTAQG